MGPIGFEQVADFANTLRTYKVTNVDASRSYLRHQGVNTFYDVSSAIDLSKILNLYRELIY